MALLVWGIVLLVVPSCSKKKEEAAKVSVPESAPAVTMKEPVASEVPVPAATEVPVPAATGVVTVRARFDGYAARVAKGLWQPVRLTTAVANFGLITPLETVPAGSGLIVDGGPAGLAVGTPTGTLQTTDGRPLVTGREYAFAFSKAAGEIWAVAITAVP